MRKRKDYYDPLPALKGVTWLKSVNKGIIRLLRIINAVKFLEERVVFKMWWFYVV